MNKDIPINEVVKRIVNFNCSLGDFWMNAKGWAPEEAANLLSRSRLDWQKPLSYCLYQWLEDSTNEDSDGRLILAWSNLGSLIEGTMKLLLGVYYKDYLDDPKPVKENGKLAEPDTLMLDQIRQFFKRRIWNEKDLWDEWISHIQQRRNAIHAFKDREIGTFEEYQNDLRIYLDLLRYVTHQIPYPDEIYRPAF